MKFGDLLGAVNTSLLLADDSDCLQVQTSLDRIKAACKDESSLEDFEHAIDLGIRKLLDARLKTMIKESGKGKEFSAIQIAKIPELFSLAIWLTQNNYSSSKNGLPFVLLQEAWEASTIQQCECLMTTLEPLAEKLRSYCMPEGRRYLLRACVDLLKRLCKAADTVFSGRVLIFLASIIPLSDKSGLNVKSEPNSSNTTEIDEPQSDSVVLQDIMEDDEISPEESARLDYSLYQIFWGLQRLLQSSTDLWDEAIFRKFSEGAEMVLSSLKAVEVNVSTSSSQRNRNNISASALSACRFPKYLTASRLLSLELRDAVFRRQILLQLLIILHAIPRTPPTPKKGEPEALLSDFQRSSIKSLWVSTLNELENTGVGGKQLAEIAVSILQREAYWISWKRDEGCKPFEIPSTKTLEIEKSKKAAAQNKDNVIYLGNRELTRLWNLPSNKDILQMEDVSVRSAESFLQPVKEEMDPEAGIEEQYKRKNNKTFVWRAIRMICKTHLELMTASKTPFDLESLVNIKEEQAKKTENASVEQAETSESVKPEEQMHGEETVPAEDSIHDKNTEENQDEHMDDDTGVHQRENEETPQSAQDENPDHIDDPNDAQVMQQEEMAIPMTEDVFEEGNYANEQKNDTKQEEEEEEEEENENGQHRKHERVKNEREEKEGGSNKRARVD